MHLTLYKWCDTGNCSALTANAFVESETEESSLKLKCFEYIQCVSMYTH